MATRNKHIRTPYEDERKKHRAAASRHVLVLEVQIKEDDKRKLFHIANDLRIYGNHLTNIAQKRVSQLFRTKAYREALKQYHDASSVLSSLDKGTQKYHEAKEKVKDAADALEKLQAKFDTLPRLKSWDSTSTRPLAVPVLRLSVTAWCPTRRSIFTQGSPFELIPYGIY